MNEYVIGVDLGTSAVKVSAMNKAGEIVAQQSYDYPLSQPRPGYSEQAPQDWLYATTIAIDRLILRDGIAKEEIQGISFSGQMHGLVQPSSAKKLWIKWGRNLLRLPVTAP